MRTKSLYFVLLIIFVVFGKTLLAQEYIKTKSPHSFELGIQYSNSEYTIDTFAHSILEWQKMNAVGPIVSYSYNLNNLNKFKINTIVGFVYSGKAYDDDLENLQQKGGCASRLGCGGTFSRTKTLSGLQLEIGGDFYLNLINSSAYKVNLIVGAEYKSFNYKPKGYYQIGVYSDEEVRKGKQAYTWSSDIDIQWTHFETTGPKIGIAFERGSEEYFWSAEIVGFVSLYSNSHQSNWGNPDWRVSGDIGDVMGFDLKLASGFKVANKTHLTFYGAFSYLKGINLQEFMQATDDYAVGNIRYLSHQKISLGASIQFQS